MIGSSSSRHEPLLRQDDDFNDNPNNNANTQSSFSQQPAGSRRVTTHVGGFSTSLCDMFSDPSTARADCCALTCCGLFVSDRTHHLLKHMETHESNVSAVGGRTTSDANTGNPLSNNIQPHPNPLFVWTSRLIINACLPMLVFLLLFFVLAIGDAENLGDDIFAILFVASILTVLLFVSRAQKLRLSTRLNIINRIRNTNNNSNGEQTDATNNSMTINIQSKEVRDPHMNCPCHVFIANDAVTTLSAEHDLQLTMERGGDSNSNEAVYVTSNYHNNDNYYDTNNNTSSTHQSLPSDLCSLIWKYLSKLCCGQAFGCWLQCCGICAVAQEDRQLKSILSASNNSQLYYMDYVTFQKWSTYWPDIYNLRFHRVDDLSVHFYNLSELSKLLVKVFGITTGLICVLALVLGLQFHVIFLIVLVFAQSFTILYFVWWGSDERKFDLSLDAIIKYFASGFVLCTGMVVTYEVVMRIINFFVFLTIFNIWIATSSSPENDDDVYSSSEDDRAYVLTWYRDHRTAMEWVEGTIFFIYAFFVAASVEEISKYFSFWMVEHPDFVDCKEFMGSTTTTTTATTTTEPVANDTNVNDPSAAQPSSNGGELAMMVPNGGETATPTPPVVADPATTTMNQPTVYPNNPTLVPQQEPHDETNNAVPLLAKANAITIAMVAVALGFACCENLFFVFVFQPPSDKVVANEIWTLIYRSILPIHPITAAIQSLNVIRRDIEGDLSYGLGKIILPSFLLHGLYDFIIFCNEIRREDDFFKGVVDDDEAEDAYLESRREDGHNFLHTLEDSWFSTLILMALLAGGAWYYLQQAQILRNRLEDLEYSRRRLNNEQNRDTSDIAQKEIAML